MLADLNATVHTGVCDVAVVCSSSPWFVRRRRGLFVVAVK